MDGMHRVGKALLLGRSSIDAVQFNKDPEPDYVGVCIGTTAICGDVTIAYPCARIVAPTYGASHDRLRSG